MQTGFRLEDELIAKIDQMAAKERRKRTAMVEILLYEAALARDPKWKPKDFSPE